MKANELMIGDWVLAEGKPLQVTNISCLGGDIIRVMNPIMSYDIAYASNIVALSNGAKDINKIEPIPLTPEILEKNFGKPYPRDGFHNYRMEKDETIAFVIEDRRVSAAPDNRVVFCRVPGTYICDVNYVHELQHALKLCGIEKEVVV